MIWIFLQKMCKNLKKLNIFCEAVKISVTQTVTRTNENRDNMSHQFADFLAQTKNYFLFEARNVGLRNA